MVGWLVGKGGRGTVVGDVVLVGETGDVVGLDGGRDIAKAYCYDGHRGLVHGEAESAEDPVGDCRGLYSSSATRTVSGKPYGIVPSPVPCG